MPLEAMQRQEPIVSESLHMSPDEFRAHAHRVVDWMCDYFANVEQYPVRSVCRPGEIAAAVPDEPPQNGDSFDAIMSDLDRVIMPGVTHWQHPSFFAYFPANSSPPSVLAEMITSALAVNCMLWVTSPAGTELETRVLGWLARMIGLPASWQGVIQDTASSASLCAILCARERFSDFAVNERGFAGGDKAGRMTVYTSDQAHSSIEKGAKIAGIGRENVRVVPTDQNYAMDVDALREMIEADRHKGMSPIAVVATVGTTSSTAIDPLRPIGEVARQHNLWFHIDAALAGTAAILPEFRWLHEGVELADSYCFNPHKWMLTNFDCSAMYCHDADVLKRTFSIQPEYLRTDAGGVIDYRDWGVALGRRFRALKLWVVIRSYGVEGIRRYIRHHIDLAQEFAGWINEDPAFELLAPHPLNTVCFRWIADGSLPDDQLNAANKKLLDAINDTGEQFLTHTKLSGRYTIRMAVGQTRTLRRHVEAAWENIQRLAAGLA
jgi:aromatic-L-amino-acid decarboxylase